MDFSSAESRPDRPGNSFGHIVPTWLRRRNRCSAFDSWAADGVAVLERLLRICDASDPLLGPSASTTRLHAVLFDMNVLTERGRRLLVDPETSACVGRLQANPHEFRAAMLAPLAAGREIANAWPGADARLRADLRQSAELCLKAFVTLAQHGMASKA